MPAAKLAATWACVRAQRIDQPEGVVTVGCPVVVPSSPKIMSSRSPALTVAGIATRCDVAAVNVVPVGVVVAGEAMRYMLSDWPSCEGQHQTSTKGLAVYAGGWHCPRSVNDQMN